MAKAQKHAGVRVEIALFGLAPKLTPLSKYAISQVDDLIDVIHQLESKHTFLKKIKYRVTVNDILTKKNQTLFSGDKIVVRPQAHEGT